MNEGMKIILERLKTNPEEFESIDNPFASESKWTALIHKYERNLPAEDVKAFKDAIDAIRQEEFTANVMKELLAPEEDNSLGKPWYSNTANVTHSGGVTLGAYANTAHATIQLQQAQAAQNQQLHTLLHHKALQNLQTTPVEVNRKPTIKVRKPQHETLFGKLKNYLHTDT